MKPKETAPETEDDFEEGALNESLGFSQPTSLARRDNGLGSSRIDENRLIVEMRKRGEYGPKEGLTMRGFLNLDSGQDGYDQAMVTIIERVTKLADLKDGDFVDGQYIGYLVQKLVKRHRKSHVEFTRSTVHMITTAVLGQLWHDFGSSKIRLKPSVLLEVLGLEK